MKDIFWDKKISVEEIKNILKNESHPRFIYFASLLLARTGKIKEVFSDYLDKVTFCKNWRKIKQRMRKDKWSNPKINFWEEVYKVALQEIDRTKIQIYQKRDALINPEVKELGSIIKKSRKKIGWTQKKIAQNIGLSQQTISLIENGNFNFSFSSLIKILSALKLKIAIKPKDDYSNSVDSSSPYSIPFKDVSGWKVK